jgi:hypothetical protein
MKYPSDHNVILTNGWSARFAHKGEFKMGCDYWDLELLSPADSRISFFVNKIVLVNDWDGSSAKECISLTEDGRKGYLRDGLEGAWVIDFECRLLAPHRWHVHHSKQGDSSRRSMSVAAYEQPCYKGFRDYLTVAGKLIYLTFPLSPERELESEINQYLSIRRRQLEEVYWI